MLKSRQREIGANISNFLGAQFVCVPMHGIGYLQTPGPPPIFWLYYVQMMFNNVCFLDFMPAFPQ